MRREIMAKKTEEAPAKAEKAGMMKEFKEFLKEYKVIGLAIAFIIGTAATVLIKALVDYVIMPLIGPLIPGGAWQDAKLAIGPVIISWGQFLAAVINFVIIALVVFLIAKKLLKEDKVTKK
jgi:large conductance mechanosensitive channel